VVPRQVPRRRPPSWVVEFGKYSSLGIEFAFTFLAFGALGYLVDRWAGTYPFLMILGIFLGAAAGFVKLYYSVFPPKAGSRRSRPPRVGRDGKDHRGDEDTG